MSPADWYLALYALLAGTGIAAYWVTALVFESLPGPPRDAPWLIHHVVAEFLAAGVLIMAGVGRLIDDASWLDGLTGIGLGLAVYALAQSPPFYPDARTIRIVLTATWAPTTAAVVVLLTSG